MAKDEEKKDEQEQKAEQVPEKEDYKEKFLRLAAEFDNYKKRIKNDIDGAKGMGKAELAKTLLPVLDEFELTMIAVKESEDENLIKGIELLYSNFFEVMKKSGLVEIPADGTFDPYKHEIIMVQEDEKSKPGTIIEVAKKGYTFGGVMIRPASVIVAKEKAKDDKNNENKKDDTK